MLGSSTNAITALQGLSKSETAEKYGEEQVKIWRRTLRSLVMQFEKLSEEEVVELGLPTGIPLVYTFGQDMNVLERRYISGPDVIAAKVDQLANQGKAK